MMWWLTVAVVLLGVTAYDIAPSRSQTDESRSYCPWDTFNASCGRDEVIVMRSARYGRMQLGLCLSTEVYIGCGADVLPQVDARCSGRQQCILSLPDSSLHDQQPCPRDMMVYLEASYTCMKAEYTTNASAAHCLLSSQTTERFIATPIPVTSASGLLSNQITRISGLGGAACPWHIVVARGQTITLTLLDFTAANRYENIDVDLAYDEAEYCHVYAVVREKVRPSGTTICARNVRESVVYNSDGNELEVEVVQSAPGDAESYAFALRYEPAGCQDIIPPADGHVIRDNNRATIKCNFTSQTWHLVCKNTDWVGDINDCGTKQGSIFQPEEQFPSYGLFVAVLIGVAIGIVCGFTMLGAVLYCKRKRRGGAGRGAAPHQYTAATLQQAPPTPTHCRVHHLKGEYGYTHVWEVQSPQDGGGGGQGSPYPGQGSPYPGQGSPYPGQGSPCPGHFGPSSVSVSVASHTSPDSAYQSYQGQLSTGEPAVLFTHQRREHIYESPKLDPILGGTITATIERSNLSPSQRPHGKDIKVVPPPQVPASAVRHLPDCVVNEVTEDSPGVAGVRAAAARQLSYGSMGADLPQGHIDVLSEVRPERKRAENEYT